MECDPLTICACVIQAAQLGLEPDNVLGEAYLVPFYNSKTRKKECQLIPGYQGLLKLARNSGELKFVNAQVVREKDIFEFVEGTDPYLTHKRATGDRGKPIAYWACASLKTGGFQFVVMTYREVEEHRDRFSKAKDSGPWKDDFDAMAMKTCLRKLCKLLPRSAQTQIATSLDEAHEAGRSQSFSFEVPLELHPSLDEEPATAEAPERVGVGISDYRVGIGGNASVGESKPPAAETK
jgi:recombination protein RecT